MKKSGSFLANCILACGVMYYVLELSSAGRTAVDWTVICIVGLIGATLDRCHTSH